MWFDSHCHLQLADDPAVAAGRARAAGVEEMIVVGIEVDSSRAASELAESLGVWASAGVHPNDCEGWGDEARREVRALLEQPRVVAVGETGLDFYRDHTDPDLQRVAFRDHIALAKETGKALIIHTRDSVDAALDELEDAGPPQRLVFHCWSAGGTELGRALESGAMISFAGNVTFRSAGDLRERLREVPEDRLLVETDTPYLAPVPHRGHPNEPAYVPLVGRCAAEVRETTSEHVAAVTRANARRVFGLS